MKATIPVELADALNIFPEYFLIKELIRAPEPLTNALVKKFVEETGALFGVHLLEEFTVAERLIPFKLHVPDLILLCVVGEPSHHRSGREWHEHQRNYRCARPQNGMLSDHCNKKPIPTLRNGLL
jgi:hypothetical protein